MAQTSATGRMIAGNLRRMMKTRGLTQQQLADLCEWSQPRVHDLLSARHDPRISTLEHVANALGIAVNELLAPAPDLAEPRL